MSEIEIMPVGSDHHDDTQHNGDNVQRDGSDDAHDVLILYATETGTAQAAADRVARECRRARVNARVADIAAYPPESLLDEALVVFLVATTGSGAEPRSMSALWSLLLRSDLPPDLFEDLDFAVFGLGDTSYEKFCWPAKKLCRRLNSLGAREVCARGEGDEQDRLGIEGALDKWIDALLDALLTIYPLPEGVELPSKHAQYPPRARLVANSTADVTDPLEKDPKYYIATVSCNRRITADDWFQDVRHFEFDFDSDIEYDPGDVAVIHPHASPSDVDAFLADMDWSAEVDTLFGIQHTHTDQSLPDHLPRAATLRTLFTRYVDFNAVPRRGFFEHLRHFASDDMEREKLDEFVSEAGAEDLYDYCQKVRRTVREVLAEFRSVKIPLDYIFDLFPPLRPREFSIASSVHEHPRQVQLCVAIVRYRTKLKVPRVGVCTRFLAALKPGDRLRIGLRKGVLQLPPGPQTPVICVGPGTGIAPMRAVIEERVRQGAHQNTLYFGCRSTAKDEHYASEWADKVDQQQLTYRVARSRDGPEGVKRTYVQDLMREDAARLWELVGERGASLFISGSSNKMPAAVREAVAHAVHLYGGRTEKEAKEYVQTMEREGRLIEECWS